MKPRLSRLVKLHAVRSSMADAAVLRTRRIDADLAQAASTLTSLRSATAWPQAYRDAAGGPDAWRSYLACHEVAARLEAVTTERMDHLHTERAASLEAQRSAFVAREQALRLRDRCAEEDRVEAERREQLRLDEAHLIGLARKALPTRF